MWRDFEGWGNLGGWLLGPHAGPAEGMDDIEFTKEFNGECGSCGVDSPMTAALSAYALTCNRGVRDGWLFQASFLNGITLANERLSQERWRLWAYIKLGILACCEITCIALSRYMNDAAKNDEVNDCLH